MRQMSRDGVFANDAVFHAGRMRWIAGIVLVGLIGGCVASAQVSKQAPQESDQNRDAATDGLPPVSLDGAAALHHLNQVLNWYHHTTTNARSVGLPSDAIYQDNARTMGAQAVQLAFQSAKAESAMIAAQRKNSPAATASGENTQAQRLAQLQAKTSAQIDQLQTQIQALSMQLAKAPASRRLPLTSQRDSLESQLELQKALLEAIQKMTAFVDSSGDISGGFEGDITRLAKSVPEVLSTPEGTQKPVAAAAAGAAKPTLANSGGLISEAITLYDYISVMHQIDGLVKETDSTRDVADHLRVPLRDALRATIQRSQELGNQPPVTDPQQLQAERKTFQALTRRFKEVSSAMVPLSQEIIVLNDSRTNLEEWRSSISQESKYVIDLCS